MRFLSFASTVLGLVRAASTLKWKDTKYMIALGDSYTTTGFNITNGINSSDYQWTSSSGPSWVQYLTGTFNTTEIKTINLAVAGALTTNTLITPYIPTVVSLDGQAQQVVQHLVPSPPEFPWSGDNTLFAIWIGINDIYNSYSWTNISHAQFHSTLTEIYLDQVELLYREGARSFLILTVPPIDRAPLFLEQGPWVAWKVKRLVKDYNRQLTQRVKRFLETHLGAEATIYDTSDVFDTLLNNGPKLGLVNVTGYATPYQNYGIHPNTQAQGYAPLLNYFWINSLHPVTTVHYYLALAISTVLSGF